MSDADLRSTLSEERTFYVINLCAAPVPLPLEMPGTSGLEGLVVFRSHEVQEGRHRYRLHLGYFESREAAQAALPLVKERYPAAWIAAAPRARLGSLDDTGNTDFRLIQAPAAALSSFTAADSRPPAPARQQEEDAEAQPQRYAVQLVWSSERTAPDDLPPVALFDAYTLYTVTCQRGGVRLFGVRLGFFRSAISASQVAVYVRPDFPSVAVVPVSDREFAYASWLVRHRGETDPAVGRPPRIASPRTREPAAQESVNVAAAAIPRPTPTQVEIARIRSPDEIPLSAPRAAENPQRAAAAVRRPQSPELAARLAALDAHEQRLRTASTEPEVADREPMPAPPYRSNPFPERRSVFVRLLTRLTDRRP